MRKAIFLLPVIALVCVTSLYGQADIKENLDRATALYDNGMWSAAAMELRKVRVQITEPGDPLAARCDCMISLCAAEAGEGNARALLEKYLEEYPHSIYHNDIRYALAGEIYKTGEWEQAVAGYLAVDPFSLPQKKQGEYQYRLGDCYFRLNNYESAARCLRQVDARGEYGSSATYYLAYIDYINGNYGAAKQGFSKLTDDSQYGRLVPFYLLQIEFLEGNYTYVTQNADRLISASTKPRAADMARITAESWYHLQNHEKALEYIVLYRSLGGEMGREESYMEGYCLYMTGRYRSAADALAAACGTDDALSQNAGYHLADCYLKLGEKRLAMQSFSIASVGDFDPSIREDALFNYGKLQYELGGGVFNEAINVLNRYITEYPKSSRINQAREYLISAYYNSHNYEAAYEAIKLIPNPDNNIKAALQKITYFRALEYFTAGDMDEAQRLMEISARNRYNMKYTALANFWRGEVAYQRGDFKAAVPFYREYIALAPKSEPEYAAAQYALGYSYFNQKQWDQADQYFNNFLAQASLTNALKADTYNRLGDIKYANHAFWPALDEYEKAAKLGTAQQDYAQWRTAFLLGLVDRTPRKIEELKAIVASDRSTYKDVALYELGRTYMNADRYSEAASSLESYVEKYPAGASRLDALSDLALVNQNIGRSDRALGYYKQIVASAANTPQAKDAMAGIRSIYVEQNDVDSYFAYAASVGQESDLSAIRRDSISFASAERLYLTGNDPKRAASTLQTYLNNYPKGTYRVNALHYLGDCSLRAGDRAASMDAYVQLAALPQNEYTLSALQNLSRMEEQDKHYNDAMESYLAVSQLSTVPAEVNRALEGYLRTARQAEDVDMGLVAQQVLASPHAGEAVKRQAEFINAGALEMAGQRDKAMDIYKKLSAEVQSPEGAESAFRIIDSQAAAGNNEKAKELIFAFAKNNSPQVYWTGRAFLLLGDIYAGEGDSFQARATYQSIVDGYSIPSDGTITEAKERIKNLK